MVSKRKRTRATGGMEEIWRYIATGAVGCLLTMTVFVFKESHGQITLDDLRRDMPGYVSLYSPYTQDAKEISSHLSSIDHTLAIIDARQQQQASDIASIAASARVTARPIQRSADDAK